MSDLTMMAKQYLNSPYKWGGNGPFKFDCSGLVLKCLSDVGILLADTTAQGLHAWCFKQNTFYSSNPNEDCLLFFGKSTEKISHIAIAINERFMIEAGGGDSTFTNPTQEMLRMKDARVRIKDIKRRKDLVDCIKIVY